MRAGEASELLCSLSAELADMHMELGTRGDAAYLRLSSLSDPERWAVVSTPGDRWFGVEVNGGFCSDRYEEDTSDDDVRKMVAHYVEVAAAYVSGVATPERVGRLGTRIVRVTTGESQTVLRRSVMANVRDVLRL